MKNGPLVPHPAQQTASRELSLESLGPLESIRAAELELVRGYFQNGARVLEVGGGSGFQANAIASWDCHILSIDLPFPNSSAGRYHPVAHYDGIRMPVRSESVDVVFCSNVVEHIHDLPALFREIVRVIKPDGVVIHVLPSVTWRLWTSVLHYPFLLRWLSRAREPVPGEDREAIALRARSRGPLHIAKRILFGGPHGPYANALTELYHFRRKSWRWLFEKNGFSVQHIQPSGIYHSGYLLWRSLSLMSRRRLARAVGSSANVFVMRKKGPTALAVK